MKYDCDYYYFKSSGKWKYHGKGKFPEQLNSNPITRTDVIKTNGSMPGITSEGLDLLIVIIPTDSCNNPYAYPRIIFPMEV